MKRLRLDPNITDVRQEVEAMANTFSVINRELKRRLQQSSASRFQDSVGQCVGGPIPRRTPPPQIMRP